MSDFGHAVRLLAEGREVQREAWQAKGIRLALAWPEATGMTDPFIFVRRSSGAVAPWQACHNDLLAADWQAAP